MAFCRFHGDSISRWGHVVAVPLLQLWLSCPCRSRAKLTVTPSQCDNWSVNCHIDSESQSTLNQPPRWRVDVTRLHDADSERLCDTLGFRSSDLRSKLVWKIASGPQLWTPCQLSSNWGWAGASSGHELKVTVELGNFELFYCVDKYMLMTRP